MFSLCLGFPRAQLYPVCLVFQNVRDPSDESKPLVEHLPGEKKRKKSATSQNQNIWYFNFLPVDTAVGTGDDTKGKLSLGLGVLKEEWQGEKKVPRWKLGLGGRCHTLALDWRNLCFRTAGLQVSLMCAQGLASALIGLSDELPLRAVVRAKRPNWQHSLATCDPRGAAWPEWSYRDVLSWFKDSVVLSPSPPRSLLRMTNTEAQTHKNWVDEE